MARRLFPHEQVIYGAPSRRGSALTSLRSVQFTVYRNPTFTVLADITTPDGEPIANSRVDVGDDSTLPQWLGPDEVTTLYIRGYYRQGADGSNSPLIEVTRKVHASNIGAQGPQGERGFPGALSLPGTVDAEGNIILDDVDSPWGIDMDGNPYYNEGGTPPDEAAFLTFDPFTKRPVLVPIAYDPSEPVPVLTVEVSQVQGLPGIISGLADDLDAETAARVAAFANLDAEAIPFEDGSVPAIEADDVQTAIVAVFDRLRADLLAHSTSTDVHDIAGQIQSAITDVLDGAPTAFDTLREIAEYLAENEDVIGSLTLALEAKVATADLDASIVPADLTGIPDASPTGTVQDALAALIAWINSIISGFLTEADLEAHNTDPDAHDISGRIAAAINALVIPTQPSDIGAATAAQGAKADSAVQPGALHEVAFSGDYEALLNKPVIPPGSAVEVANDLAEHEAETDTAHNIPGQIAAAIGALVIPTQPSDIGAATAAQGEKADTAVQPGDLAAVATSGDYEDLDNRPTLGTAAAADTGDFATATQGSTADTAVQPGDLAAVALSGDYDDLSGAPTLGTAAAEDVEAFATAAQGAKADTAVQPGVLDAALATKAEQAALAALSSIVDSKVTAAQAESIAEAAVDAIVAGAPAAYDTLMEIATYLADNDDAIAALNTAISNRVTGTQLDDAIDTVNSAVALKADQADLTTLQATVDGKAAQADLTALQGTVAGKADSSTVTTALSGKVDKSTVTTKGDILAGTGAAALARLAAGANGRVLAANSATATGLEWIMPPEGATLGFAAGQAAEGDKVLRKSHQAVNAKDVGMVGDNATDDTSAFNAAMTLTAADGVALYLPRGQYRVPGLNRTLTSKVRLVGEPGTRLIGTGGATAFIIGAGGSLEIENCEITGFTGHFCSPGSGANGGLVRFRNVWFHDIGSRGTAGGGGVFAGAGGPVEFEMDRCTIEDCYWGIRCWSDVLNRASVTNSVIRRVGRSAIRFGNDLNNVQDDGTRNVTIANNFIDDVTQTIDDTSGSAYNADGIRITMARDVTIKGNTIVNVYNTGSYSGTDNCQAIYTKAYGVIIEGNTCRNAGRYAGSIVCKGGSAGTMGSGAKVHANRVILDSAHPHNITHAIRMESWKGEITDNQIVGFKDSPNGIISVQGESNLGMWRDQWVISRNTFYDWGGTGPTKIIEIAAEKNFEIDGNVVMPGGGTVGDDAFIRLVPGQNQSSHQKRFVITNNKVYGITQTPADGDSAKFLHIDMSATNALTSVVIDGNVTFDTIAFVDLEINTGGTVTDMTVSNNHCFGLAAASDFIQNASQAPNILRMGNFVNGVSIDGVRLGNTSVTGAAHFGGTAAPAAGLGSNGDWYWRTDGQVYKKASGSWSTVTFGGGSWDGGTVTGATTFTNSAGTTFDKGTTGRTVVGGDAQWFDIFKNDTDAYPGFSVAFLGNAAVLAQGDGSTTPLLWLTMGSGVLGMLNGVAKLPLVVDMTTLKTADYALVVTDHTKTVRMGGTGHVLTIPTNATAAIPVGAEINVHNEGTGLWAIAGAGGVTVRGVPHVGVDQHASLIKTATDTWFVRGPANVICTQAEYDALDTNDAFSAGATYTVGN